MMILAQTPTSIESAAIEALKSSPGYIMALVIVVLFLRFLTDQRKNDTEERKQTRETLDRLTTSQQNLAVVVEGLKENLKR